MGCAHHFRPTYADADVGKPSISFVSVRTPKYSVEICGIPHLAKNERDVGHPRFCCATYSPVLLRRLLFGFVAEPTLWFCCGSYS